MTAPSDAQAALADLHAHADVHDVRHDGGSLRWRRWGRGAPVVLLHGGHGCWMHWARNIDALATTHAVWVPDMPGYGDSSAPPSGLPALQRLQVVAGALAATLDQLLGHGEPIALAGFSFGGLVAAELALQRGKVDRLALLGTAGHGGTRRQTLALRDWRVDDGAARTAALRHNLAAFMLHAPEHVDALAVAIHRHACERTRLHSKDLSRQPLLKARLDRLACPVWLAWGEHDVTAMPAEAAQALADGAPGRSSTVIAGGGHWVQYECAEAVKGLLRHWLATG